MSGSPPIFEDSTFALVVLGAVLGVGLLLLYRMIMYPSQGDPAPDPDDTVIIVDAATEMEMELMRSKLASLGIGSFMKHDFSEPDRGHLTVAGWKLFVRYADVDEARRVLGLGSE